MLPNLYAVQAWRRRLHSKRSLANSKRTDKLLQLRLPRADTSAVSELPTEILVKILEHLIPTDRIFHFSPRTTDRASAPSISGHHFCRGVDWSPGYDLTRLASTCQRLRDVSYGLWYGRNQFVIDVAATALTSEIQLGVEVATTVDMEDGKHSLSWNRLCTADQDAIHAFYPSTPFTMNYITDLTICINISSNNSSANERHELSQQLESIVACFGGNQPHLRRLAVSLDVAEQYRTLYRSKRLELCGETPRMILRDQVPDNHVNMTARQAVLVHQLVEPFLQLRGVGDVVVRGLLNQEFKCKIEETVTKAPEIDNGEEEPSRKRARRA